MKPIKIFSSTNSIKLTELTSYLGHPFDTMVKFVVDIKQNLIAFGGEMHADAEKVLLENGSIQEDLWGANIYPEKKSEDWLEYTSLINIRPSANNMSMELQSNELKELVSTIINEVVPVNE